MPIVDNLDLPATFAELKKRLEEDEKKNPATEIQSVLPFEPAKLNRVAGTDYCRHSTADGWDITCPFDENLGVCGDDESKCKRTRKRRFDAVFALKGGS